MSVGGSLNTCVGLRKSLREGEPLPAVFTDPVMQRASTWVLSTSAVFSKHFGPYGWGEVVPNGFGVPYLTGFDGGCSLRLLLSCDGAESLLRWKTSFSTRSPRGRTCPMRSSARRSGVLHRICTTYMLR